MKQFEIKNTDVAESSVKDVDKNGRRVKVAISKMGNLDLDNDIIDKGAYNRTIKQRGPKGTNLIWHLTDHNASLKSAIGKFSELSVQGDCLVGVTDVPNTTLGNDMLELYDAKHINQHSVGFRTLDSAPMKAGTADEYRLIKEILLYEGSAVLWGANPETPTLSVGKSITKEEAEKDFFETIKEINSLHKLFKTGHLSDQTFELIEVQLVQKTNKLQQLFENATQLTLVVPGPAEKGIEETIKSFTNSLKLQINGQGT